MKDSDTVAHKPIINFKHNITLRRLTFNGLPLVVCLSVLSCLFFSGNAQALMNDTVPPVFEVETVIEVESIGQIDNSPQGQLQSLAILEQVYALYVSDCMDGFSQSEAQERLKDTLSAIGFEPGSAKTILAALAQGNYAIPKQLIEALQQLSQAE